MIGFGLSTCRLRSPLTRKSFGAKLNKTCGNSESPLTRTRFGVFWQASHRSGNKWTGFLWFLCKEKLKPTNSIAWCKTLRFIYMSWIGPLSTGKSKNIGQGESECSQYLVASLPTSMQSFCKEKDVTVVHCPWLMLSKISSLWNFSLLWHFHTNYLFH